MGTLEAEFCDIKTKNKQIRNHMGSLIFQHRVRCRWRGGKRECPAYTVHVPVTFVSRHRWLYGERSQRGSYWNWTVLFIWNVHSYCDRRVSRECKKHTAWRGGWQTSHLAIFIPLVNKLILNLTLPVNWCQLASKPQHKSDSLQDRWVALFTSGLSLL